MVRGVGTAGLPAETPSPILLRGAPSQPVPGNRMTRSPFVVRYNVGILGFCIEYRVGKAVAHTTAVSTS
eukprot:262087-Pleurochrysis_carterae.AAC.1